MEPISRRSLIVGTCAILATGMTAVPAEAKKAVKKLPGGKLSVNLKAIPDLAKIGGSTRVGSLKGVPVAIARTGTSEYVAFSLKCPHAGTTVSRDEKGWLCRAHLSEFEADGKFILGTAATGLEQVPIKVSRGKATLS